MNYPSPCEIVPDGIGGFDQLVVNHRQGGINNTNPSELTALIGQAHLAIHGEHG